MVPCEVPMVLPTLPECYSLWLGRASYMGRYRMLVRRGKDQETRPVGCYSVRAEGRCGITSCQLQQAGVIHHVPVNVREYNSVQKIVFYPPSIFLLSIYRFYF
jgi:hypothetical protein